MGKVALRTAREFRIIECRVQNYCCPVCSDSSEGKYFYLEMDCLYQKKYPA